MTADGRALPSGILYEGNIGAGSYGSGLGIGLFGLGGTSGFGIFLLLLYALLSITTLVVYRDVTIGVAVSYLIGFTMGA